MAPQEELDLARALVNNSLPTFNVTDVQKIHSDALALYHMLTNRPDPVPRPTMFELVSRMNVAFGNPQGDPNKINGGRILSQMKNVLKEYEEFQGAMERGNIADIRDAICDMIVYLYGAIHLMGYSADEDIAAIVNANFSKFCRNLQELKDTRKMYDAAGVKYYEQGQFPYLCLKSAEDQGNGEYPKDKFLKGVNYRAAVLRVVPALRTEAEQDPVALMRKERIELTNQQQLIRKTIDGQVEEYRRGLESGSAAKLNAIEARLADLPAD